MYRYPMEQTYRQQNNEVPGGGGDGGGDGGGSNARGTETELKTKERNQATQIIKL